MNNTKYSFSSTQINLPKDLADSIIKWGKETIPDNEIFKDPSDPSFGREDEIHVTVLYGIHSDSSLESKKLIDREKPFTIELGKIGVFTTNDQFDVVKINVNSPELHSLNKKLVNNLEHTNKFKEYQPHITVAYLKKGKGWKYQGNNVFNGKLFQVDHVYFSSKNGKKTKIEVL